MAHVLISMAILVVAAICLYQVWRNIPFFPNYKADTFIGFTASKRPNACGQNNIFIDNDSMQLGVNDPNYTGYFFETTLPDGTVVKTHDRICIGSEAGYGNSSGTAFLKYKKPIKSKD